MMKRLREIAKQIPLLPSLYRASFKMSHACSNWYFTRKLKSKSTEHVFSDIYMKNSWHGKSSVSGTGSDSRQTRVITTELPRLIDGFNVATMLDIPCGDFYWMNSVNLNGIGYIGADIVEDLIQKNKINHIEDNVSFQRLDLIKDILPKVDLVFCRDCLVHLSFEDILLALRNICMSQSEYLLTTTFTDRKNNFDIATGQWRPINLEITPFMLPKPIRIINEECTEANGLHKDKALALWRVVDIQESLIKLGT